MLAKFIDSLSLLFIFFSIDEKAAGHDYFYVYLISSWPLYFSLCYSSIASLFGAPLEASKVLASFASRDIAGEASLSAYYCKAQKEACSSVASL